MCLVLRFILGPVAQPGERCVRNAEAEGSNPFGSTKQKKHPFGCFQTVDKGHECLVMFVAFSMQIFNEIVEIPTLELVFVV